MQLESGRTVPSFPPYFSRMERLGDLRNAKLLRA